MDGDEVRHRHQLLEVNELDPQLCGAGRVGVGVISNNALHIEGRKPLSKELPDMTESDDAHGLAIYLDTFEGRPFPLALPQRLISLGDLASGREQQGDRMFAG